MGIDAFDLKEDEIDITPFLPLLCDGKSHNFTIRVSGLNDDGNGSVDGQWELTGRSRELCTDVDSLPKHGERFVELY